MRLQLAYVVDGAQRLVDVCDVQHAVRVFCDARDREALSASQVNSARVVDLDEGLRMVARISYNGRAWCWCGAELQHVGGVRYCARHAPGTARLLDAIERGPKRETAADLAARVVAQVGRNLDALHAKRITVDEFTVLQRATWGQLDGKPKAQRLALESQAAKWVGASVLGGAP